MSGSIYLPNGIHRFELLICELVLLAKVQHEPCVQFADQDGLQCTGDASLVAQGSAVIHDLLHFFDRSTVAGRGQRRQMTGGDKLTGTVCELWPLGPWQAGSP